jgi:Mg2+-importing ATPase
MTSIPTPPPSPGLSTSEAASRLAQFGPNVIGGRKRRAVIFEFLYHFRNPLVLILLVAGVFSAITGDTTSFVIINTIVLAGVLLDFIQEHRASRAAEKLSESVALQSRVLRDGKESMISAKGIVPGDVVVLSAGDLVPADGEILESRDFFVNEAMLTGEPYPVEKSSTGDADAKLAFMGSSVMSGSAHILISKTGAATAVGQIAKSLNKAAPPTAFELGARQFGLMIMRLTIALVLFVVLVNAISHRPFFESFLFAVALAVGLTPELLPMVVSVTLAKGAMRMADKHVIVKKLSAIHGLGSMDVLCTDKTGTLTEAHIRLERHVDVDGNDSARVLELAYINSYFETGLKSPLDDAILKHSEIDVTRWRKLDEVPFDFERRRVSVLVEDDKSRLLVVKGAPEDVMRLCTGCEYGRDCNVRAHDAASSAVTKKLLDSLSAEGFRVLGIAWRNVPSSQTHAVIGDEASLTFAGFAAFLDPPKVSASAALKELAADGVTVKVVTGDNDLVTQHVCRELGLPVAGVLTGTDIAQMDDQALAARVDTTTLFCRVNPAQKDRVILALKHRGHTVGYMGDGINDAPPLHSADVGISVQGAVDVAREAADLILLEDDLGVLHQGVLEGRRTFSNILKYINMGTSSNFGNMFSMAGGALLLPFLPMRPVQILLNNLLYDVSEIAIPLDTVDEEYVRKPRQWDMKAIRNFMFVMGPISSLFDFLTFFVLLKVFHAGESMFQTGWFIESMATQVLVIFIIRTTKNPFRSRPNGWLAATSIAVVIVAAILPLTPMGSYFGFVAPPLAFYAAVAAMATTYLIVVEFVKRWFYVHMGSHLA